MTMFAEPILASSAEERMEGMRRDYHHYPQHHETPDHLREKNYHYSDSDDREVGSTSASSFSEIINSIWESLYLIYQSVTGDFSQVNDTTVHQYNKN